MTMGCLILGILDNMEFLLVAVIVDRRLDS